VVLLAGDAAARLPLARSLAEHGSRVLVVSAASGEDNAAARALCTRAGDLTVHCFTPVSSDTRAEARAVARMVMRYHWHRITVVTSSYHVVRARLLVQRCTDAEVQTAYARVPMPVGRWAAAFLHESSGLLAAAVERHC